MDIELFCFGIFYRSCNNIIININWNIEMEINVLKKIGKREEVGRKGKGKRWWK